MKENIIKSKQRVADYGEVLTPRHIVNAMLDLVKQETERIDSRFLEPACGTGNFLVEVLQRKLQVVQKRYAYRVKNPSSPLAKPELCATFSSVHLSLLSLRELSHLTRLSWFLPVDTAKKTCYNQIKSNPR